MSYRNYSTANGHIVDASGNGDYTTIASALAAASSGQTIFIRPGTYTEDLTLKAAVNLSAYTGDAISSNVTIVGKATFSTAGSVSINNIKLQTNSDFFLEVTGSAASVVTLNNCSLSCTNNTGISFTTSSSSALINIFNCVGNLSTTGIGLFSSSSAGTISFFNGNFTNSGGSTTASSASAGMIIASYTVFSFPISSTSTASLNMYYCRIETGSQNATSATFDGSGTSGAISCQFSSGSAAAVSIGGSNVTLDRVSITSTNSNPVTGAGTLKYTPINFLDTGKGVNTTTRTPLNYGTWTPTLTGSSTAGTTTYTTQSGFYTIVGNLVYIEGSIVITNATGTGNALIGNFPFTIKNLASYSPVGSLSLASAAWAWSGTTGTQLFLQGNINTTNATCVSLKSAGAANLAMTNGAGTFNFNMWYQI